MNATGDHGGEVQGDLTPGTRWMTYRELADFLGVEEESSRRRAQRARNVKLGNPRLQPGNAALARVATAAKVAKAEAKAADLRPVITEIRAAGVATLDGMAKALTARGVPSLGGGAA